LPPFLHAGRITWTSPGANVFFQINFTNPGSGLDLSDFHTLDFRVDRESPKRTPLNSTATSNFHVQLVAADGTLSAPVSVANFIVLEGPFGTPDADLTFINPAFPDGYHINSPTARIPMDAFDLDDLQHVRGIRLTFDATASGKVYVANFRASRKGHSSVGDDDGADSGAAAGADAMTLPDTFAAQTAESSGRVIDQGNVIENVQYVASTGIGTAAPLGAAPAGGDGTVLFTVHSNTSIPVGDELPLMSIGSVQCDGSYVDGSTQRMMFECPAQDLWQADGASINVRGNAHTIWNFGTFSTSMLN
jgi:hypothetical protein